MRLAPAGEFPRQANIPRSLAALASLGPARDDNAFFIAEQLVGGSEQEIEHSTLDIGTLDIGHWTFQGSFATLADARVAQDDIFSIAEQ